MTALRIGDRVQCIATGARGTVFGAPRSALRVGVFWDRGAGMSCLDAAAVVLVSRATVPPEARPIAVGAMAGGGR